MKQLLFLMAQLVCVIGFAQDTTFVRSLPINSTVRNIDSDGEFLYLRFEDKFYKWKNNMYWFQE